MATLVQNAVKGQRKAMEILYENNKQKVFFVAKSLLDNDNQACEATAQTFKGIFAGLKNEKINSEKDFTDLAVRRVAEHCKKAVLKRNSRAYAVPAGKNFAINNPKDASGITENYAEFIFNQFSDLQKLIFTLHTAGGVDENLIAVITKLDVKTVKVALDAEKENVERICGAANGGALTYNAICESFMRNEKYVTVSPETDKAVAVAIESIAAPIAKARSKKILSIVLIALTAVIIIAGGVYLISSMYGNDESSGSDSDISSSIDMDVTYYADIDIKDYGTITVKLDQSQAPKTVENFVNLANSGFYDGLTFHRIIEGFMMQGGDPDGNGTGGSDQTIVGEFTANGYNNTISHKRGVISMARSDAYNSASSQFFIMHEDYTGLDGKYAAFGYVTEGLDVVDAVCEAAEPTDGNGTIPANAQPVINKITIRTEE